MASDNILICGPFIDDTYDIREDTKGKRNMIKSETLLGSVPTPKSNGWKFNELTIYHAKDVADILNLTLPKGQKIITDNKEDLKIHKDLLKAILYFENQ